MSTITDAMSPRKNVLRRLRSDKNKTPVFSRPVTTNAIGKRMSANTIPRPPIEGPSPLEVLKTSEKATTRKMSGTRILKSAFLPLDRMVLSAPCNDFSTSHSFFAAQHAGETRVICTLSSTRSLESSSRFTTNYTYSSSIPIKRNLRLLLSRNRHHHHAVVDLLPLCLELILVLRRHILCAIVRAMEVLR